ncbi:hypothetical protein G9A89_016896 [Geosiphon pyriformis]|nr:hypothetical protein G9A89_016896 [Geosiphon pyriformis]
MLIPSFPSSLPLLPRKGLTPYSNDQPTVLSPRLPWKVGELLATEENSGTKTTRKKERQHSWQMPKNEGQSQLHTTSQDVSKPSSEAAIEHWVGWSERCRIIMTQDAQLLPTKITDETLLAGKEVIKRDTHREQGAATDYLSFQYRKTLINNYGLLLRKKKRENNSGPVHTSTSKRKKKKARRFDKAVSCTRRKIMHLQNKIHKMAIAFFIHEFDVIIILPFDVSNMVDRKTRKLRENWSKKCFLGHIINFANAEEFGVCVIVQSEAYMSKTCSWCGNVKVS